MSFSAQKATPIEVSSEALDKIVNLKTNEGAKFFRVYVTGGGCSGFQYGFKLDENTEDDDTVLKEDSVSILIDSLSIQYLFGSTLDYVENLGIFSIVCTLYLIPVYAWYERKCDELDKNEKVGWPY